MLRVNTLTNATFIMCRWPGLIFIVAPRLFVRTPTSETPYFRCAWKLHMNRHTVNEKNAISPRVCKAFAFILAEELALAQFDGVNLVATVAAVDAVPFLRRALSLAAKGNICSMSNAMSCQNTVCDMQ